MAKHPNTYSVAFAWTRMGLSCHFLCHCNIQEMDERKKWSVKITCNVTANESLQACFLIWSSFCPTSKHSWRGGVRAWCPSSVWVACKVSVWPGNRRSSEYGHERRWAGWRLMKEHFHLIREITPPLWKATIQAVSITHHVFSHGRALAFCSLHTASFISFHFHSRLQTPTLIIALIK